MLEIEYEEKLVNSKDERINIGTIGHVDHGRISLIAAITKYCSLNEKEIFIASNEIDVIQEEKSKDINICKNYIECPGNLNFVKDMITNLTQMNEAIVVTCGPIPEKATIILENNFISKYQQGIEDILENVCELLPIKDVLDIKFNENISIPKINKRYLESNNRYYGNVQKKNSINKNMKQYGYIYRRS